MIFMQLAKYYKDKLVTNSKKGNEKGRKTGGKDSVTKSGKKKTNEPTTPTEDKSKDMEIVKDASASYKALRICLDVIPMLIKECLVDVEGRVILMDSFNEFISFVEKCNLCPNASVAYSCFDTYMVGVSGHSPSHPFSIIF
jgi:hypothetical protein